MGNQIGSISDDDDTRAIDVINITVRAIDMELDSRDSSCYQQDPLPIIRSKPSVEKFQSTDMYKEIRARCGLIQQSNEHFNLLRSLQQRENGLASPGIASFSSNQQRNIANMYIPNQKTARLMSLDSKVYVTKFNKSGTKLLTACQDGFVRIYDGSKGTYHLLTRINARDVQWSIIDADFSPNGQHFAYSTWSRSFFIMPVNGTADDCQWIDVESQNSRVAIFSLQYSPTGDKIIGGSNNGSVIVGDVQTRSTQILRTHRMPVTDVNAVSYVNDKDPNVIIAGCDDGLLKVFDLRVSQRSRNLSKAVVSFIGHYDGITYIDSRNDGYYLLSNSKDQSIKIWDMRQPSNLRNRGSARRQQRLLPTWDYRWERVPREICNPHKALEGDSSVMTYRGHRVSKTLLRAKFSPLLQTGQRYIYTGCATGRIIIYDVLTGRIKEAIEGHRNVIRDLDWHPERSEIISGSWDTHINLNTYNRNMAKKSLHNSDRLTSESRVLRRSRRLANRNMTPD
ncbi:DDB1- and CUL4-associated factor 11 isoform X2 [Scaptodrosophila lebanonensis]|uniref:DDB1- and CUL4-associated factor 11 isoform X2 n=1 Tax=Drosophila lebanonensis TaxID=7225 RepID=A0A6J2UHR9_DROLE|nr:DDB1- and CUL4-associated factor 11 isoform X2 [Scaptodrosophila lebanonensis]